MYGSELSDEMGRIFARTDGETYHYWGCLDLSPASFLQTVLLFNIPASIPVACFINITIAPHNNFVDRGGLVELVSVDGLWCVRYRNNIPIAPATVAAFTRFRLFVFLPARYVPQDTYGVQCFNESGAKTFDSARPVMQLCGLATNPGETPLFFNRNTSLPASCMNNEQTSFCLSFRTNYNMRYYASQVDAAGGWGFTSLWDFSYTGPPLPITNVQNVSLIDGNYYSQFPNLPSF